MNYDSTDISVIGHIFARTITGNETRIPDWEKSISDMIQLAKSASSLMCIFGAEGSGKTTFLKNLQDRARQEMDILHVVPASHSVSSGWLIDAIAPWLSSDSSEPRSIQHHIAALAETARPILICVDSGDLIQNEHLTGDIAALLNLADTCGVKLSILLCCSQEKSMIIAADRKTATRLIYIRQLPRFTESQIVEFISSKVNRLEAGVNKLSGQKIQKIARDANGSPAQALKLIAASFGHEVPSEITSETPVTTKKHSARRDPGKADPLKSKIDELLAPPKD